jgi:hypothetical protein
VTLPLGRELEAIGLPKVLFLSFSISEITHLSFFGSGYSSAIVLMQVMMTLTLVA